MQVDSDLFFGTGVAPSAPQTRNSAQATAWLLAGLALALFVANVALHFPGVMNNDSVQQYRQALTGRYGDWHPPVMAWLWSWLRVFGEGPAPFLVLHLALYWLGFGLVADAVRRSGHPVLALAVTLAGAFPPFLYVNAQVVKDVGMAVSWLAAIGLLYWHRSQARPIPWATRLLIVLLLAYGTLVRTNAIFGLGPLLLFALAPASWLRNLRLLLAAVVVAVVALPAGQLANRVLFQPQPQHATQSLFLFDLMGIAVHTGDPTVLQPRATLTREELHACYSPYWWDSLSPWGRCAAKVNRPADPEMVTQPDGLAAQWARAILEHPGAYLAHRLKHFNSALLLAVPLKHIRLTPEYVTDDPQFKPLERLTERDVRLDWLRKNPAVWPAVWLAWAVCLLVLLQRETPSTHVLLGRVLAASALGYSGAYLLIGVATDMRYHYWSLLAVMLATLVVFPTLVRQWRRQTRPFWTSAAVVACVVLVGVLARAADFRGFM